MALEVRLRRLDGPAGGVTEMVCADRDRHETLRRFSAVIAATRDTPAELIRALEPLRERTARRS